ncbi:MAG: hypothetical protein FWD68_20375 [Alphaproteobacteria bacterium]|nr:hypothetical protein [Alphaproteobacteria bacterium]
MDPLGLIGKVAGAMTGAGGANGANGDSGKDAFAKIINELMDAMKSAQSGNDETSGAQ